jgi:single-strand DNA-binding protein
MASLNKVCLIGNCGRDPELRTFPSGGQVCNVSIATAEKWKDKQSGEMMERTEWHNLVFSDRLAEIAGQYLKKGSQVYVEGQIRNRKYQDKDGVERTAYEIRVRELVMLGGGESSESSRPMSQRAPSPRSTAPAPRASSGFDDMDDDIPF